MAADRSTAVDNGTEATEGPPATADQRPPPDRPGSPGAPSRADSRAGAAAANAGSDSRAHSDEDENRPAASTRQSEESVGGQESEAGEEESASTAPADTSGRSDDDADASASGNDPDIADAGRHAGALEQARSQGAGETGEDIETAGTATREASRTQTGEPTADSADHGCAVPNAREGEQTNDSLAAEGLDDVLEAENDESPAEPEESPASPIAVVTTIDIPLPEDDPPTEDPALADDTATFEDQEITPVPRRSPEEPTKPSDRRPDSPDDKTSADRRDRRERIDANEITNPVARPRDDTTTPGEDTWTFRERAWPGGPSSRPLARPESSGPLEQHHEPCAEGSADEFSTARDRPLGSDADHPVLAETITDVTPAEEESERE